jgi:hypothetical protein
MLLRDKLIEGVRERDTDRNSRIEGVYKKKRMEKQKSRKADM